jgi:hypothetical protein
LALQSSLDGGPLGPSIKVFFDRRHDEKVLAQMMKTTFFKYWFLTVKYCQNTEKYGLLDERTGATQRKKISGKNLSVFSE